MCVIYCFHSLDFSQSKLRFICRASLRNSGPNCNNKNKNSWSLSLLKRETKSQSVSAELAAVGLHMYVCTCEAITRRAGTAASLLQHNGQLLFLFHIDFSQVRLTCMPHHLNLHRKASN